MKAGDYVCGVLHPAVLSGPSDAGAIIKPKILTNNYLEDVRPVFSVL